MNLGIICATPAATARLLDLHHKPRTASDARPSEVERRREREARFQRLMAEQGDRISEYRLRHPAHVPTPAPAATNAVDTSAIANAISQSFRERFAAALGEKLGVMHCNDPWSLARFLNAEVRNGPLQSDRMGQAWLGGERPLVVLADRLSPRLADETLAHECAHVAHADKGYASAAERERLCEVFALNFLGDTARTEFRAIVDDRESHVAFLEKWAANR